MNDARPLRVMNVIARLNVGGPAVHVVLITRALNPPAHADFASTLVAGSIGPGEGDMTYYAVEQGVAVQTVPALGRELHPLRDLRTLWTLWRLMRAHRPDIVNTHTAKAGFVGRAAARLAGVTVVVHTLHGHVFSGYFSPAKTRLFLFLERLMARLSSTIIVLTDGQRDELVHTYRIAAADRFTVMPLGLELAPFRDQPRKPGDFRRAWQIAPGAPLISIVGRLVPVKNHALFLDAAAHVIRQRPDARFAIVGDGDLRSALEAQVDALGLRQHVVFTGWTRDTAPVYADSDLLIISSVNEGTPVTVIEALASGCPVVGTAVGGLPDLLDHGRLGTLVPPGDARALAEAMLGCIESPSAMDAIRAEISAQYSIDRLAADLSALYRRLADRGQSR